MKTNKIKEPLGCNCDLKRGFCGEITFANKIILCDDCVFKLIEEHDLAFQQGISSATERCLKIIDECESHSWEGHKCVLVKELKSKINSPQPTGDYTSMPEKESIIRQSDELSNPREVIFKPETGEDTKSSKINSEEKTG